MNQFSVDVDNSVNRSGNYGTAKTGSFTRGIWRGLIGTRNHLLVVCHVLRLYMLNLPQKVKHVFV